ncbi:peptidase family M1-domain-containing protein [Rhexocercosporidium sp. MPI-PUGE-AT-0058]|nr:peptidase family M1-domain-containing protein [Rhexocercosporidium sp. MPI-PUGE-AT-0058]
MARLPRNVKPSHYDLDLSLDMNGLTFQGSVAVHLEVCQETTSIVLHANDLKISSTEIVHSPDDIIQIPSVQYATKQRTITIPLPEPLTAGSKVVLRQSFHGTIKENGETPGLQWISYKNNNGENLRAYSTSCEPIGARCIFPCLDEPDLKATLSSTITINQDLTCLSNMDVRSSEVTQSETGQEFSKRVVFNTMPRTSTYLICFVIGDFDFIESQKLKFPVRIYTVKGAKIQHASNMLKVATQALEHFEDIFGLEYPLPKLDLIALPNAGGLENWGCIVFGERFMLLDPETTATKTLQMAVETLCHEIAHQWFGNLVTMGWWDDLWLNEAFAEWAGFYVVDKMFPEWTYWLHFVAADPDPEAMAFYQGALDIDSTRGSHPVYNPTASPDRMHELFDNITYMKGASLLRMLSRFLGTGVFIEGIRGYLKKHAFANATTNDLWISLSASSGRDVSSMMKEWTSCAGYPILLVSEDNATGTITLEQHRYLQAIKTEPEEDQDIYHVPLNLKTKTGGRVDDSALLICRKQTYSVDLESYKLNAGQIGLYRVSYPLSRLQSFGKQTSNASLSAEDWVGLVSDSHALISSCFDIPMTTADLLEFLLSFSSEHHFLVWRQIFFVFGKIRQAFLFSSPKVRIALQNLHRHLVVSHSPEGVWRISSTDPIPVQNEKAMFYAQAARYDHLKEVSEKLFDEFVAGNEKALNPNIRKHVFQAVVNDRYESILGIARTTQDPELRTDTFVSLGYTESPSLIQQSLALMTKKGEPFSSLEKWFLLNALQTHHAGAEASWTWLKDKWNNLGRVDRVTICRYVASCTGSLSTAEQLDDVRKFAENVDVCMNFGGRIGYRVLLEMN